MYHYVLFSLFESSVCCIFLPAANEVWDKIMFSQVCVIPSVHRGRGVASQHASQVTCPGGLHLGGLPRLRGSASRGVCIWGRGELGRPPKIHGVLWDTINKRVVRILLECILVWKKKHWMFAVK